jgi:hypothetical protein
MLTVNDAVHGNGSWFDTQSVVFTKRLQKEDCGSSTLARYNGRRRAAGCARPTSRSPMRPFCSYHIDYKKNNGD